MIYLTAKVLIYVATGHGSSFTDRVYYGATGLHKHLKTQYLSRMLELSEPSRTTFRTRNRLLCPKITGRLIESDVLPIRVVEGDSFKKLIRYLKRDEHFEKEQQVKLALHTNHRLYHN